MKITKLNTTLIFIALVSCLFSCKKEDNNSDIQAGELKAGRCRVNCNITGAFSSNFKSMDKFSFSAYNPQLNPNDNNLICDGLSLDEASGHREEIVIHVKADAIVGNYNFTDLATKDMYVEVLRKNTYTNVDTFWVAKYGDDFNFNITKIGWTEMEGTFSGTVKPASVNNSIPPAQLITISNGTFRGIFLH